MAPDKAPFRINITLPRNRYLIGRLELRAPEGDVVFTCQARGKADNRRAEREGNKDRNPVRPFGDTPTGEFNLTRVVAVKQPGNGEPSHLGGHWIPLASAKSGQALEAIRNGRTGLGIHAGKGDLALDALGMATHGCVRLKQTDFYKIAGLVGQNAISVTIVEADAGTSKPPPGSIEV